MGCKIHNYMLTLKE